jgi:hypothetical protein
LISVGSEVQILPGPPFLRLVRGRSSAGRAPALQAGGRRFEPDRLHQWRTRVWPEYREKCRNSVLCVLGEQAAHAVPCASPVGMRMFFVRVNQVLERLWARPIAKSDRMVGGFGLCTSSGRGSSEARRFHYVRAGVYCPGGDDGSCCVLSR